MEDQLCFQGDNKLAEMRGGGYYHEIWVRQDASWWLKDLRMTRTYVKVSMMVNVGFCIAEVANGKAGYRKRASSDVNRCPSRQSFKTKMFTCTVDLGQFYQVHDSLQQ